MNTQQKSTDRDVASGTVEESWIGMLVVVAALDDVVRFMDVVRMLVLDICVDDVSIVVVAVVAAIVVVNVVVAAAGTAS